MPACFQLIDKGTGQPARFNQIDNEMRIHFGAEPDPDRWFKNWYLTIGFALATGNDWNWCRENFSDMDEIIDYLELRFDANSWQEIGRSRA